MIVIKRNKTEQRVDFNKILERIRRLTYELDVTVDETKIAQETIQKLYDRVSTQELDELSAEISAAKTGSHPDYNILAARILQSNNRKNIPFPTFCGAVSALAASGIVDPEFEHYVVENRIAIEGMLSRYGHMELDYFGFKTLQRSYLLRFNGRVAETPEFLFMRVSCAIHKGNLRRIEETYRGFIQKRFIHATPTLFNAGTVNPQLSSCFLLPISKDSIKGIYKTLDDCASISKFGGGIGINATNIRAQGSVIKGTNGISNGIVPMLKVYNATARYVDQGGGKRKGSFAVYIEPWHADIVDFLQLKKNHGAEEMRARDLFYALWIPDEFMLRVKRNEPWHLYCPTDAPNLSRCYGEDFTREYKSLEDNKTITPRRTIQAQKLWRMIMDSQQETGTPYMLYKNACNSKSNHKHLGVIGCSNLCTEIIQYSSPNETAVCNLASISLPYHFDEKTRVLDFDLLTETVRILVRNLNRVIDVNFYPTKEARHSNMKHRPMGIGVQGLANVFMKMGLPYESKEAQLLNSLIFEHIYHAALTESNLEAKKKQPYPSYTDSPTNEGLLQQDMWDGPNAVEHLNWEALRYDIRKDGLRNSLLIAPMPTASTSQILGNIESFEPITSNLYVRRTLSGEFIVVCRELVNDLQKQGLWSEQMRVNIIRNKGSIQHIDAIPDTLKKVYKTVWEMSGRILVDMAAERGRFIDQSQSFNLHMMNVTMAKLSSFHFYAWKKGLKTGMYYLRTKAAVDAIQFTVDKSTQCDLESEECLSCGS